MHTSSAARSRAPVLKFTAADATFEGYASLFNVVDQGGDVVLPGAFRDTLRRKTPRGIRLLFQHKPDEPIGVWEEIAEDARGLYVRGRLACQSPRGAEVAALMRAGAIDGLSIGFRVLSARRDRTSGRRLIAKVDLWEISVVTFPMLSGARVSRVATPGMATPITARAASLPQEIAAMARRMRERLVQSRARAPQARAAELAGERVLLSLMRLALLEQKFQNAKFNPHHDALGRFATGNGAGGALGRAPDGTPVEPAQMRRPRGAGASRAREQYLVDLTSQARQATDTLRQLDPTWREPQSAFPRGDVEGNIRHQEMVRDAARARLAGITRDALPGANPTWGVNRLTKELYDRGFRLSEPTNAPGLFYENAQTGEQIRIMERPRVQWRTDPPEKHTFDYYYRYRTGRDQGWRSHIPIPDKN